MTTNVRALEDEYPLLILATEPIGTSVDKDTFDKIVAHVKAAQYKSHLDLLDDPDGGTLMSAWTLAHAEVKAFGFEGSYYVVVSTLVRAEGATKKMAEGLSGNYPEGYIDRLPEWDFDQDETVISVLGGYENATDACRDAKKLLIRQALCDPELRGVLGWRQDVVLLVRGYYWIIARIRRDGPITLTYTETPMPAAAEFLEQCDKLASEIELDLDMEELDSIPGGGTRAVAAAFIVRQASELLLAQAKLSLTVRLKGANELMLSKRQKLQLGKAARNLYTDMGTLNRARDRKLD